MRLRHFFNYVCSDVRARRTWQEAVLGVVSVWACTISLLVILVFTSGFYSFIDHCFYRAKPVIGSVQLMPKNRDLIRLHSFNELDSQHASHIESRTWISTLDTTDMQFWKSSTSRFERDEPTIWAIPDDHNHLLAPKNGVQWIIGSPPEPTSREDRRFEVFLNVAYLERFAEWTESDIKLVLTGKHTTKVLPKEVYVHFGPIKLKSDSDINDYFEPGTISLPVTGVFALRESWAPDIVLGFDVAAAYYYQNRQRWHPGFVLQFNDGLGNPLIRTNQLEGRTVDEAEIIELPKRSQLIACETLHEQGLTPFRMAAISISDYKHPEARNDFKSILEEPQLVATIDLTDLQTELESGRTTQLLARFAEKKIDLSSKSSVKPVRTHVWRLSDREQDLTYQIDTSQPAQATVHKLNNWHIEVPSDTASGALKRVTRIVDFYSDAAKWTVVVLATLMITLVGMGYINRKSLDIGILKTQGIHPLVLGCLYSAQVLLLSLVGFVFAVLAFGAVLGNVLEPIARATLNELTPTYVTEQAVMSLGLNHVLQCLKWICLAVLLGSLWPAWLAMTLDPIKDLRTGV